MKKILFLILFLFYSCGYEPIYINKNNTNFKFQQISFEGDENLNNKLSSKLFFKEIIADETLDKVLIKSSSNKIEASKNSKGHVTSYKIFINVNLIVIDPNNKIKANKVFNKDFLYNVDDDKLKTSEYQKEIENNLINQIVREINVYLKL